MKFSPFAVVWENFIVCPFKGGLGNRRSARESQGISGSFYESQGLPGSPWPPGVSLGVPGTPWAKAFSQTLNPIP